MPRVEQTIVRQELLLQTTLGALIDWIASFAHPLVTRQMLRHLGRSLVQRNHLRTQLTQIRTKTQAHKKSAVLFQNLLQECGWETRLTQETTSHIDLVIPTCPFGKHATENENFCTLHSAVCGEAAIVQFGYAKINLLKGPGIPPQNCSIRVYTLRTEESVASEGIEYESNHNGSPTEVIIQNGNVPELSPREYEVLQLVSDGLTDKEIATNLNLSVRTAENYVGRVRDKLNIRGRAGLIRFALKNHINSI